MTVSEEQAAAAEGQPPRVPPGSGSLAAAVLALPPLALVVVGLALAFAGGGVAATQWEPVAVGMALCLAALAAVGILPAPPRVSWPPLLALGGYVVWSALSLLWSQAPDATVDSVARSALLAGAAVVGASFGARPRVALALSGALALAAVILAVSAEFELLLGDVRLDDAGRLAWPIDYANASAVALWMAVPILIVFCQLGGLRSLVRGGLGACAGVVLAVGLTAQSRAGVLALVAALAVCTVLAANRARFALSVLVVFAPLLPVAPWLASATSSQSSRAASVLFVTAAAGGLVAALSHADRHGLFPLDGRQGRLAAGIYAALGALLVVGFLVVASGRPDTWLRHRYDEFSTINPPSVAPVVITGTHYDTASSDRYDYWRVALHAFADHPVGGVGAGAFATPWYRLRVAVEDVNDPHSWIAQALSETGVVGLLLLGAGLLLPFRRARGARGLPPERHVAVVTLTGASVYFVAHAASDWTLRIPGVALPGLLALGELAASGDAPLRLPGPRFRAGGLAVGLLVAAITAVPYLSTRELVLGEADANDRSAIDKLRLSADLNPFSLEPLIVASGVWLDAGDKQKAIQVAREAVDRNPDSWVAWENLSQIGSLAGSHDILFGAHRRAVQLNPYLATRPNG